MKKTINRFLLALLVGIVTFSCSDEDNPFNGDNSHIVSFSLTKNEVNFPAYISGNDIIVEAPHGVDLSSANVKYELSENASLQPDPKTIDNWNEEHIFRVNAWNNQFASYKYTVKRTEVAENNDVVLLTQADVNVFAAKKITEIKGNLIIGHITMPGTDFDTIKDISSLKTITNVNLNLVINNSFLGSDFSGLRNIKSAGGIYFGSLSESSKLTKVIDLDFANLESANNIVINTDSLATLKLPMLSSAGNIYVNSNKLSKLDVSKLEKCNGDLIIKAVRGANYSEKLSNSSLERINLKSLKSVGGTMLIENFWKVSDLNLSNLKKVEKDLLIKFVRTINTINIPELTSVNGFLNIQSNDGMAKFAAPKLKTVSSVKISSLNVYSINLKDIDISALEAVNGDLEIYYAAAKEINMPNLKTIDGELYLTSLPFIEKVSLPELTDCGKITLNDTKVLDNFSNPKLNSLDNLKISKCFKLSSIKMPKILNGNLELNMGDKNIDIPELNGLEEVEGLINIRYFANESINLDGIKKIGSFKLNSSSSIKTLSLPDVTEVSKSFEISRLDSITNFSAPMLESVGEDFTIKGCFDLKEFNLPKLTTITGKLTFYGGNYSSQASKSKIENLNSLLPLAEVGSVQIRYASKLSDFSGLKNVIGTLSASKWIVQKCAYNPTYQNMVDGIYKNI